MVKEKNTTNYIVSFDTFMLQPVNDGGNLSTRVIESNREFIVPKKPIHIVRKSCDFYGGSLQNSTNTAKLMLGNRHKTPIILAPGLGFPYIFLPTLSPSSEQNVWFSYHAIDSIEPDRLGSIVRFENNQSVRLTISATTMYRQYAFAGLLEKRFQKTQQQLSRPPFGFPPS